MPANFLKILLGFILGTLSFGGFIVNLIVVVPVFRFAFLQNKSPIYLLSFINIIIDIANLLMTTFYLAPSIIIDTYFFSDEKAGTVPVIMGSLFMFFWYLGSITQIVMAVNRLTVIHFRRHDLFLRKNIWYMYSAITPICLVLMSLSQYGFPCCAFVFDHKFLSYSYNWMDEVENYSNKFIDLPLNFASTATAMICYAVIVWTVRKTTKTIALTLRKPTKNREFAYAIQFFFISIFYTFAWITFRVFPMLIGGGRPEWFIVISMAVVLNNTANALVYLISNKEVLKNLRSSGLNLFTRSSSSQVAPVI